MDLSTRICEQLRPLTLNKLTPSEGFLIIQVNSENLEPALGILVEQLKIKHLSTITGLDLGDGIGLDYEFSEANLIIAIRTILPKTNLKIQTATKTIPGAILYEMEIHDMFGVVFQDHPWMDRKLLLPDNYPADMPPPLLKTSSSEKIRKAVGIEK
ncbi:MAG TPA: NADH-quinone oxidoreductase subunit C [Candidatus Bathyarchaeia archaeon]|nr:NADH-quinone oxidoreductase subunit C [Candidatus Bathyarchaeia archaeon]